MTLSAKLAASRGTASIEGEHDELLVRVKVAEAKIARLTELRDYWRETGVGHWRELSEIIEK